MNIAIKKTVPTAKIPARAHDTDAAYDLYAVSPQGSIWLHPGERHLFDTGISMSIPKGYYGHICDRSGNALKKGLTVLGGIVDSGYFGSVGVILLNAGREVVEITDGFKIAQIIFKKHETPEMIEVTDLGDSERENNLDVS